MPQFEYDRLMKATLVPEISKIKIGDRLGKNGVPNKTEPTVTSSLKPKGGKSFATDEQAMAAIKKFIDEGRGARPKNAIPVRLFSDKVEENLFMYRGIFNAANTSMCMSLGGNPKAQRRFKEDEYKKGILPIIDKVFEVDCDDKCKDWRPPGVKGNCTWHANLIVMLDIPGHFRFPSRTVFRTSGFKVMEHMIGSLNAIRSVTGGVLANIPLWLVMHEIEGYSRAMNGRSRYPVMSFEYWGGSIDDLRNEARREISGRRALAQGIDPNKAEQIIMDMRVSPAAMATPLLSHDNTVVDSEDTADAVLGGEEAVDIDSIMSLMDEGDSTPATAATQQPKLGDVDVDEGDGASAMHAEAVSLKAMLRLSDMAYEMLDEKHDGVLANIVDELRTMARQPEKGAASAIQPHAAKEQEAADFMDLIGGDDDASAMAETSDMPAEDDPEVLAMQARAEAIRTQGLKAVATTPPPPDITPQPTVASEMAAVGSEDDEDSPWFVA